jgi:hypothetical protein
MSDEELCRLLRVSQWDVRQKAADRIEALVRDLGLADDQRREWERHCNAAEALLDKAVEALTDLVKDCEAEYPPSHGAIKYFCRTTLAEIGG